MNATLEHIWHEFAEKLGQFIRARVADPATAEDILQDVFVKIQKRLGQLQDPAKLEGWIYLIARNAIIDHYRTRKETVEVPESLPAEPDANDAEIEELKASFRRMIYSLPEPYRDAVVLTELDGLDPAGTCQPSRHFSLRREIARATRAGAVEADAQRVLHLRVRPARQGN